MKRLVAFDYAGNEVDPLIDQTATPVRWEEVERVCGEMVVSDIGNILLEKVTVLPLRDIIRAEDDWSNEQLG